MTPYRHKVSLHLDNAGCDRGGVPIVRGVDLAVEPGEAVQLFGSNGSGKSTLLNLLAGHSRPAEGTLAWKLDGSLAAQSEISNNLVYIAHQTPMKSALTAFQNLTFWARNYGVPADQLNETVYGSLKKLDMLAQADLRAGLLSAGQRRRIDLARTIIAKRPVWLMDEPSAAIDEAGANKICAIISGHLSAGGIAIIATHDPLDLKSKKLVIG